MEPRPPSTQRPAGLDGPAVPSHAVATQSWIKAHMLSTLQPLVEQIKELQADFLRLGRNGSDTETRLDRAVSTTATHYKELQDLRTTVASTRAQCEGVQIELTKGARQHSRLETDHEVTKGTLEKVLEQVRPLAVSFEAMQRQMSSLDSDFRALRTEVAHKHRVVGDHIDRMDRLKDLCEGLNIRHMDMIKDLGDVTRLSAETERSFQAFLRGYERAEDQRQTDAVKIKEALWLKEHVLQLQQDIADTQRLEVQHCDEVKALEEHVKLLVDSVEEDRKKDLQSKLDELEEEQFRAKDRIDESLLRVRKVEGHLSGFETTVEGQRGAHEALKEAFEGELKRMREVESGAATALGELRNQMAALDSRCTLVTEGLESMTQAAGKHASMPSRLDYLEKAAGQSAANLERLSKDLSTLRESKASMGVTASALAATVNDDKVHEAIGRFEARLTSLETSIDTRLSTLESQTESQLRAYRGSTGETGYPTSPSAASGSPASPRGAETSPLEALGSAHLDARLDALERAVENASLRHQCDVEALEKAHRAMQHQQEGLHERHGRDLEALRAGHEGHAVVVKSLRDLEASNSEAFSRQSAELSRAQERLEAMARRCDALERAGGAQLEARQAAERLAGEHRTLESGQLILKDRIQGLEEKVREVQHTQRKDEKLSQGRLDRFEGVLEAYERTRGAPGDLERALAAERAWLQERVRGSQVHCDALRGQVEHLEGTLANAVEDLTQKLRSLEAAHARLAADVAEGLGDDVAPLPMNGAPSLHGGYGSEGGTSQATSRLGGRHNVAELAQWVSDIASKQEEQLRTLDAHELANVKLTGEVHEYTTISSKMSTRVEELERRLVATAADGAKDLASMKASIDDIRDRCSHEEAQHRLAQSSLEALRQSAAEAFSESAALQVRHGSLMERIERLESACGLSAERQDQDIDSVRGAHAQLTAQVRELQCSAESLAEDLRAVKAITDQTLHDATGKHSSLQDRFDRLEEKIARVASESTKEREDAKALGAMHADRMAELGRRLGDLAKLEDLDRKIDDVAGRHAIVQGQASARVDQVAAVLAECRARDAGTDERLQALEASQGLLRSLQVHSGVLTEKVGHVEDKLAAEGEEWRSQLKGVRQQLHEGLMDAGKSVAGALKEHSDEVTKMFEIEQRARESHERAVQQRFLQEHEAKTRQDDTIQELIRLEREAREKQREAHRSQLEQEVVSREVAHQELADRLAKEKALREAQADSSRETAEKILVQVQSVESKTAALGVRFAGLECEQKRQQDQLAKASSALQLVQATVDERAATENAAAELAAVDGGKARVEQEVRGLQSWKHDAVTKIELQALHVKKVHDELQRAFADVRMATAGLSELKQDVMETNMKVSKLDLRYDACNKHLQGMLKGMQDSQKHVHLGEHGPWGRKVLDDYTSVVASPKTPRLPAVAPSPAGDAAAALRANQLSAASTRLDSTTATARPSSSPVYWQQQSPSPDLPPP